MTDPKPFLVPPPADATIGYSVTRRPDGGMHYVFTATDEATLLHWREFAARHLEQADHNTRNLYDLRRLTELPEKALRFALEAASDPGARNVRTAIVVSRGEFVPAFDEIAALSEHGNFRVFTDTAEAEDWLTQPFSRLLRREA